MGEDLVVRTEYEYNEETGSNWQLVLWEVSNFSPRKKWHGLVCKHGQHLVLNTLHIFIDDDGMCYHQLSNNTLFLLLDKDGTVLRKRMLPWRTWWGSHYNERPTDIFPVELAVYELLER